MNLNKSKCSSGNLNYLVVNHLLKEISLEPEENEKLLSKIKENLDFGSFYDFDLNIHPCSYEQRKEIYERVEKHKLDEIFGSSKKGFSRSMLNNEESDKIADNEEKLFSNDDLMEMRSELQPKEIKKESPLLNSFNQVRNSKLVDRKKFKFIENLHDAKLRSFKHMKSILGHISTIEDNIINPVPIYCVCYSENNELIFTGDNNGLIKIWSSRTGGLVEIFKSHEKAINDILLVKDYLISCSEDMSIKIWNVKQFNLIKTINFDESVIRVLSCQYINELTERTHDVIISSSSTGKIFIFDLEKVEEGEKKIQQSPNEYENEMVISKIYFDKKIMEKFFMKKIKNNLQQSCMAVHKTPGILICGYNEGLICVWDIRRILDVVIKNNKFLYDFEKYILFLEYAHNSLVHISEFNKVGDYFITAGIDGHVLIWKVQENILKLQRRGQKPEDAYPIFSIFKISENEERIRCSVNVAIWSTNNNYVVSIISSKSRKKTNTTNIPIENVHPINNSNNPTLIRAADVSNENTNNQPNNGNNHNESKNNDYSNNRNSSILVYSKSSNSVIKRYDHKNRLAIHDECYVLEPHPENDEIILTVINSNEIIIFNFISGNILCRFTEENYFFNNISQNMIAVEGKFSPNGDSFVISTYLGSISIYSIYSRNSFSTTPMNQFLDKEFKNESSEVNSSSAEVQIDLPFVNFVNMYNLPYIVQQPYSKFKLEQMENSVFKRLIRNYNFSQKQIENKLMNNYLFYSKHIDERRIECEREEKIFIQAAKENLTYMVQDNLENNTSESEFESNNSEYNSNDDITSNNIAINFEEEEENESILKSSMDLDVEEMPEENGIGQYNLRERRGFNNRNNTRSHSNRLRISTRAHTNTRPGLRTRINTRQRNYAEENEIERRENNRNVDEHDTRNGTNTRRRLRKINRNNIRDGINYSEEKMNGSDSSNYYSDSDGNFTSGRKTKRINRNLNKRVENDSDSETYDKELKQLLSNCENLEKQCFLCKFSSKSIPIIGPFVRLNEYEFKIDQKEISIIEDEYSENEKYYFHKDCLISFNDFIVTNNQRRKTKNRINLTQTIENIVRAKKQCWRCNSDYATKKCSGVNCERYFHGYICLTKYCVEVDVDVIYCIECYKKKFVDSDDKQMMRKMETHAISKVKLNSLSREFFLKEKFSGYTYFPQIGDRIYFVIHAYEDFLRNNFENIILEINDGDIFFWKSENFLNFGMTNINNNYTNPFLCEVIQIEYAFPNINTQTLIKSLFSKDWQGKLKIVIKLKLKILSTDREINIVFFENDYPDFMINAETYEKTETFFKEFMSNLERNRDSSNKSKFIEKNESFDSKNETCLSIVIGDQVYWSNFIKLEPRENNEIYKHSYFENILMQYENQDESQEKEYMKISFWDIFISMEESSKKNCKTNLMQELTLKLDDIYNRNINKYSPFYEMVDEVKDMATDYYNIIPVPMFLKLIKSRLSNFYYQNIQSIEFDLNLIEKNAVTYNSITSQITKNSKLLINEIKLAMNSIKNKVGSTEIIDNLKSCHASSTNKTAKKHSILKGIDIPEEINTQNIRTRRRVENNLNIDHQANRNYYSSSRSNSQIIVNKPSIRNDNFKTNKNRTVRPYEHSHEIFEVELKEDNNDNLDNQIHEENKSIENNISEEQYYKTRNSLKIQVPIENSSNNFGTNENGNYNLRRKRHRNLVED